MGEAARLGQNLFVSLGKQVRGLMLPKYPHHIQAGIALPTGEWKRWRQEGDAAHTMSPAGAIGVNVAIATAAVAAQELYPKLGHGPIPHEYLRVIQQKREADVRTLHTLQLGAQRVPIQKEGGIVKRLLPLLLPVMLNSPRIQRRLFFGAPLPPLDPAFAFSK